MPSVGEVRIGICYHTSKLVLQQCESIYILPNGRYQEVWMCLHTEEKEEDKKDIIEFLRNNLKN